MTEETSGLDVAIVGGGLGGLTAAALLARQGRRVAVFEKAPRLGGRGATQVESGYSFNLGPHALYRAGDAIRILRSLGIEPRGGMPSQVGGFAVRQGRKHALPAGFLSLLSTDLLGVAGKIDAARALAGLPRVAAAPVDDVSWSDWCAGYARDPIARELLTAIVRLSTYTNAPDQLSAGAAIRQLQLALSENVLYLDGGWQTMVDGLSEAARAAGAEVRASARVDAVRVGSGRARIEVDGESVEAAKVILALPPKAAADLVEGDVSTTLAEWAAAQQPVRAACLDLGLKTLPRSRNVFALGIDEPLYFSVHTAAARLAESGKAVVQVAKYLPVGEPVDAGSVEAELEALADLVQPGWRDYLEERRFLPEMVVTHAVVEARRGGYAGRPGPAVPGAEDLFVVGDWVGAEGMLADASFASAERAAQLVLSASDGSRRAA